MKKMDFKQMEEIEGGIAVCAAVVGFGLSAGSLVSKAFGWASLFVGAFCTGWELAKATDQPPRGSGASGSW